MATCGGSLTIFCLRLKGVDNYSMKRNIDEMQDSRMVFIIIHYVWAIDC